MHCVNSTVYAYRQLKFVFCLQDMHKLVTFSLKDIKKADNFVIF